MPERGRSIIAGGSPPEASVGTNHGRAPMTAGERALGRAACTRSRHSLTEAEAAAAARPAPGAEQQPAVRAVARRRPRRDHGAPPWDPSRKACGARGAAARLGARGRRRRPRPHRRRADGSPLRGRIASRRAAEPPPVSPDTPLGSARQGGRRRSQPAVAAGAGRPAEPRSPPGVARTAAARVINQG